MAEVREGGSSSAFHGPVIPGNYTSWRVMVEGDNCREMTRDKEEILPTLRQAQETITPLLRLCERILCEFSGFG